MLDTDVVVIGGGPAGSTTACALAMAGVRAIVLEKDAFPRFHIGESLLPQSLKVFERIGIKAKLDERFIQKHGAYFVEAATGRTQGYHFVDAFDPSAAHSYQVPRAEFDQLLLEHAEAKGATVRHGWAATSMIFEDGTAKGVRVRDPSGREHELRARAVVDATGRDTFAASGVGTKRRLPSLDKTALFGHFHGVRRRAGREEGYIDIIVFPHGWFWNIPFKGGVNSFGAVVGSSWMKQRAAGESLDAFFERTVDAAPWAREVLAKATRVQPCRALADFSYRVDRLAGNGWVMVGDASGFIDPLFSTGVHLAFSSALFASDTIVAALGSDGDLSLPKWADYERKVRLGAELFVGAVQAFYDGPLKELVFEEPQREILRRTITSMLAGDVFGDGAWVRFLRERFPPNLPAEDAERLAAGASPVMV
jgi:flavin-dependent dehydrogenase